QVELEKELRERDLELAETQAQGRILKEEVDEEDIAEVVSRWTGVPVSKLMEGEVQKLLHLEEHLHRRVVGQDEAVHAVADAVLRARAGIKDPQRPVGSFIFLGPTGVGKTELARALAEYLFNDEKALVRIDMSEYMEKHAVARLIGAPPGYVGYEEGGQLTEAVRRKPFSVVLFDEVEKAHHDVFNLLLQILDEGRLTDSHGRTVDFRNTVLIMTSNIGSSDILEFQGSVDAESYDRMKERVLGQIKNHFRPEFINRVDELVVFHGLTKEQLVEIVDMQLDRLRRRLEDRRLVLEVTDEAKQFLAEAGWDPVYGARPLRRAVQRELESPIARKLLSGEIESGTTVRVVLRDGRLEFEPLAPQHVGEAVNA
ncbi:MAG: AAA family ATPase, partial [Vicinamibacteria bacterium]